jgi:Domain of unknown function (DUF4168)
MTSRHASIPETAGTALRVISCLRSIHVEREIQQRFAQASTPSDQERIVAEAHDALTKAVQDQGLSVEEYNSIIETAQNNPEVRGKVLQRIQPQGGHE